MLGQGSDVGARRRALRALLGIALCLPLMLCATSPAKAANFTNTFDSTSQGWRVSTNFHQLFGNQGTIGPAAWTN
jgi:hypothetical protein